MQTELATPGPLLNPDGAFPGVIYSQVHQVFGRYNGRAVADDGEVVQIRDLNGFAEEHRARWWLFTLSGGYLEARQ